MQHKISGKVIQGDQYGRTLGFPTANLDTKETGLPGGVYAGSAILDDKKYKAGIVVNQDGRIEAHLIGHEGDAYGKLMTLEIGKFIREYKKFDTESELIAQIKKDIEICSQE